MRASPPHLLAVEGCVKDHLLPVALPDEVHTVAGYCHPGEFRSLCSSLQEVDRSCDALPMRGKPHSQRGVVSVHVDRADPLTVENRGGGGLHGMQRGSSTCRFWRLNKKRSGTPTPTRTGAHGLGNRCSIHLSYRGIGPDCTWFSAVRRQITNWEVI